MGRFDDHQYLPAGMVHKRLDLVTAEDAEDVILTKVASFWDLKNLKVSEGSLMSTCGGISNWHQDSQEQLLVGHNLTGTDCFRFL